MYTDGTYSVVGPLIDQIKVTATRRAAAGIRYSTLMEATWLLQLDLTGQVEPSGRV